MCLGSVIRFRAAYRLYFMPSASDNPIMDAKILYFDESGQTGTRLLDAEQTHFSVGSTDLSDDEAREVIERYFPKSRGTELKFRKLFRRPSNYPALISFARAVGRQPERFFCFLVDKRFATLVRMVDWLVEPTVSHSGYDWYRDDYGRRWVNTFHHAFSLISANGLLTEVTRLYDEFATDVSTSTLRRMRERYGEIAENGPKILRPFMGLVSEGANNFERHYSLSEFRDPNDVHVTSVVTSVGFWPARHTEDFIVIHDKSKHFFTRQGMWEQITSMDAREGIVQIGPKSLKFPLRVRETCEGELQAPSGAAGL